VPPLPLPQLLLPQPRTSSAAWLLLKPSCLGWGPGWGLSQSGRRQPAGARLYVCVLVAHTRGGQGQGEEAVKRRPGARPAHEAPANTRGNTTTDYSPCTTAGASSSSMKPSSSPSSSMAVAPNSHPEPAGRWGVAAAERTRVRGLSHQAPLRQPDECHSAHSAPSTKPTWPHYRLARLR
jgi:hypothetical protein